jgi:hypothetical protein
VKTLKSVESILFSPDSMPYGSTYPEWIVKWWQWILSMPKQGNPALDKSGKYVAQRQSDPNVWFLSGTFGGSVVRKCNIPLGRAILMPVINYECSFADEPSIKTAVELKSKCKSEIDDIKNLSFRIDQLQMNDLTPYRICSPLFDVYLGENNILDVDPIRTKMISDGYWMFLKPLRIGGHLLTSSGSCQSGKIMIGTTYELDVR